MEQSTTACCVGHITTKWLEMSLARFAVTPNPSIEGTSNIRLRLLSVVTCPQYPYQSF